MLHHPEADLRLEYRKVGRQHLFTSPDLPGLYVAHSDYDKAWESIPSAVDTLRDMAQRRENRLRLSRNVAACA